MTTEADPARARLRPRIVETAETGRLDLGLPTIPEPSFPPTPARRFRSPFGVAMAGFGVLLPVSSVSTLPSSSTAPSRMAPALACWPLWRSLPAPAAPSTG